MGQFSELTIKLLFLFLPGIIYYILLHKLTFRPKKEFSFFIIYSFIFAIMNYGFYALIKRICNSGEVHFLSDLFKTNNTFHYDEIFKVSLLSIILVVLYSWITNQKILYNLKNKFDNNAWVKKHLSFLIDWSKKAIITKKFDRIDVWNEIFDTTDSNYHWVLVTDFEIKQKYEGWVSKFSDNFKENELFLKDVIVRDLQDKELFRTPAIYLTRKIDNITIEFFKAPEGKYYNRYRENKENENVK